VLMHTMDVKGQCKFARSFTTDDLLQSPEARDKFMDLVSYWEGQFHQEGVGFDAPSGYTYDGHGIDDATGGMADPLHYWSAPSKESIHLMALALALDGNPHARVFVSPSNPQGYLERALGILEKKMDTYDNWVYKYPGFGGYFPWVYVTAQGVNPTPDWMDRVPSLDNGEFIWAIYAVIQTLQGQNSTLAGNLATRYQKYFNLLAKNGITIFYDGNGNVRAESKILNVSALPTPSNYVNNAPNYFLDDPYEGEMFCFFLDLFGDWSSPDEKEKIWVNKRKKLQSVDYPTPNGPITVQRGYWFSAHEQWKYLELPYLEVPINRRIFLNGERARTWNSVLKNIPGLFASVSNYTVSGPVTQYISGVGIPEISFQPVVTQDLLTPYGAFPVMLADLPTGLAWYNSMLVGSRMQGPYGSTESTSASGMYIAPVLTWDSKITSIIGMYGGVSSIVKKKLEADQKYFRFYEVVDREWTMAFPTIEGESLEFKAPQIQVPAPVPDFTLCQ